MFDGLIHWAKFVPAGHFWTLNVILLVVALVSFFYAYRFFYRKRLIEDIPTSKIVSAAQGYVELEGKCRLMDGPLIIAPLSGKGCTWYHYRIDAKSGLGKNQAWVTVNSGVSEELFFLVDDTGECVIDPDGANVTPSVKQTWYSSTSTHGLSANGGLAPSSMTSSHGLFKKFRYTEQRIHQGDPLYAIGLFHSIGGAGGGMDMNEDLRELLAEWKRDSQRLHNEFDTNKDGHIDLEEWQVVREAAYKEVLARHQDEKASSPTHMMEQTKDMRRPYILSAKAQSNFIVHIKRIFYALLTLTLFTVSISLYLINTRISL